MIWTLAVLGLIIGVAIDDGEGALIGLISGVILGWLNGLYRRLVAVESALKALQARLDEAEPMVTSKARSQPPPHKAAEAPLAGSPPLELTPDWQAQADIAARIETARQKAAPGEEPWQAQDTSQPTTLETVMAWIWGYFTRGNPFVSVGVLILFFGLAFLVKYASDQGILSAPLRLGAVALVGFTLLAVGWRLRSRGAGFGLVLQGGGIGILYLTTFGAFHLYQLIPQHLAFAGLVVITTVAVILAVVQDARALAIAGVSGGFLAPVLISTGSGDHITLFSYYALLNAGIFAVAWRKAWRELNVLGFVFTFGVATTWGVLKYQPELFATTEPFLILFFLMYLGMAVLYAWHGRADAQAAPLKGEGRLPVQRIIDGTLVFGNPLIAFGLQWALVQEFEYGIALSALGIGLIHLLLAWVLWGRFRAEIRPVVEAFVALGIIFTSLAIPYTLDNQWSSAAWALEGAGILWVGMRQGQRLTRLFGLLLQVGGGILFLDALPGQGDILFLNGFFFGTTMVALAGLFSAWVVERYGNRNESEGAERWVIYRRALWVWGLCWWYLGAITQFDAHFIDPDSIQALVIFAALTSAAFASAFRLWRWQGAFLPTHLLLAFILLGLFLLMWTGDHPGAGLGAWGWPLAWATFYMILWFLLRWRPESPTLPLLHIGGGLLLLATLIWEGHWQLEGAVGHRVWDHWQPVWLGLLPVIGLGLILRGGFWPVTADRKTYRFQLGGLLAVYCALWGLLANFISNGSAPPLPYLPLLNPLDLVEISSLLLLAWWVLATRAMAPEAVERIRALWTILGGLVFVFATAVLLRSLHHWLPIPYEMDDLWHSILVHMALSIFWGLAGLGLMVVASRLAFRTLWLLGGGLLALVVAKLFLVDLAASGTLERITSFVAVGLLLVLVGYFSPLPPKERADVQD